MIENIIGYILIGILISMMFYSIHMVSYDIGYWKGFNSCLDIIKEYKNKEDV